MKLRLLMIVTAGLALGGDTPKNDVKSDHDQIPGTSPTKALQLTAARAAAAWGTK